MAKLLEQRARTHEAITAIAAAVKPGMREDEAVTLANHMLSEREMRRGWHKVNLRFGINTTLTFHSPSEPGVVLGESDIFFIDIGPVFEQWEGDGGDTFVVGHDAEFSRCAADARAVFHAARRRWLAHGLSGRALYDFAAAEAARLGWEFNWEMLGHRISDFPHKVIFTARWLKSTSCHRRACGSLRFRSDIRPGRLGRSLKIFCSTTSIFRI